MPFAGGSAAGHSPTDPPGLRVGDGPMMLRGTEIKAVVFDAYGTLLDVGSLTAACAAVTADPSACVTLWRAKQLEYTFLRSPMGRYVDFWRVTADALDYTVAHLRLAVAPAARVQRRSARNLQARPACVRGGAALSGRGAGAHPIRVGQLLGCRRSRQLWPPGGLAQPRRRAVRRAGPAAGLGDSLAPRAY